MLVVLHEGDTFAHNCFSNNDRRNTIRQCLSRGRVQGLQIMPVSVNHLPAVRGPVLTDVLRHHFGCVAIDLQMIQVDIRNEILQAELNRCAPRFGNLAFLLFTVAHQAEYPVVQSAHFARQGETDCRRQSLAQVAGVPFHSRHTLFHMPGKTAAGLPEMGDCLLNREKSRASQSTVYTRRRMTVAYHDPVPVVFQRVGGID